MYDSREDLIWSSGVDVLAAFAKEDTIPDDDTESLIRWDYEPKAETEYLAKFLDENLTRTKNRMRKVVVQPSLNGERPSLAILRRGSGVVLINVVDWDPDEYEDYDQKAWTHKKTGKKILSPIEKISKYRLNCFYRHIPGLQEELTKGTGIYSIIKLWVYFHNASQETLEKIEESNKKWYDFNKAFNREMLTDSYLGELEKNGELTSHGKNSLFTDALYEDFKKKLSPYKVATTHEPQERLTKRQNDIIRAKTSCLRVSGVVGSGKTTVLVNRIKHIQEQDARANILVLTFNITLRRYIINRLIAIGVNLNRVVVSHYHQFISSYRLNNDLPSYEGWGPIITKDEVSEQFDHIFVDEMQDFTPTWIKTIENLRKPDSTISFFGDIDQNIYSRSRKTDPLFKPKGMKKLTKSFRLGDKVIDLTNAFMKEFLDAKEAKVTNYQQNLYGSIQYYNIPTFDVHLVEFICNHAVGKEMETNDLYFLSADIWNIRELEQYFRTTLQKRTITTFENQETYDVVAEKCNNDKDMIERDLYRIRRSKKFNFDAEEDCVKFSTIHCFKGWEARNCVLLIGSRSETNTAVADDDFDQGESNIVIIEDDFEQGEHKEISLDSLLYVGLTRCKGNLLIINIGNNRYDEFFRREVVNDEETSAIIEQKIDEYVQSRSFQAVLDQIRKASPM